MTETEYDHTLGELASSHTTDSATVDISNGNTTASSSSSTSGLRRAIVAYQGGKQKHIPIEGGMNTDLLHVSPRDRSGTF